MVSPGNLARAFYQVLSIWVQSLQPLTLVQQNQKSMSTNNTKIASNATIAAARQIFNSKTFVARITVTGIDNNDPDKTFEHRFFFDESCEELVKFFEQWGTHQCAMKMMDYAHNHQGKG